MLICLNCIALAVLDAQPRTDKSLGAGWAFTREDVPAAASVSYDDAYWERVTVPHTWNARDGQDGGGDQYRGTGWYRIPFVLEMADLDRNIFLKFDGVGTVATVYVNGNEVGMHRGNFGAFIFDVTPYVSAGRNLLAVRVNNVRDTTITPLRGDFTIYGGIYRSVHLLMTDRLGISPLDYASPGVFVTQRSVSKNAAVLDVRSLVRNAYDVTKSTTVHATIYDHMGGIVTTTVMSAQVEARTTSSIVQELTIVQPRRWHGRKDPYVYRLVVEVRENGAIRDRIEQQIGVRSFVIDPEKGFFLNGEHLALKGVNRHQDRENMGWGIGRKEHEEDFRMIEEIGANAIRLAHYQHAQEFYDLCDRGGMVVWAELALVDEISLNEKFIMNCKEQLTELIKQNYNHPSIFFWSLQNELIPDGREEAYGDVVAELNRVAKSLDSTRLTAVASRSKYDRADAINAATDVVGYNVYRGWYEGKPENFAKYADTLHARFPDHAFCISEYGAGASIHQHEWPTKRPAPKGPWHPEEWASVLHEITWKAISERPFIWGSFVWNMFDFGSDGRSEGDMNGRNDKGLVTFDRKVRKDPFYFYKANWNTEPMVHIASKRYTPRPAAPTDVKVYSNCDKVTLFVNSVSLGEQASTGAVFIWTGVELKNGRNEIRAVGTKGDRVLEDCIDWIGVAKP